MSQKLSVVLDSSPLITMCTAKVKNEPIIYALLNHADLTVTERVVQEVILHHDKSDVRIARPLMTSGQITASPAPATPLISDFYQISETDCGVIRLGLTMPERITIIDDKEEYLIACRYNLRPLFLLDLLVLLATSYGLDKGTARDMVQSTAKRYSPAYVAHTQFMLR